MIRISNIKFLYYRAIFLFFCLLSISSAYSANDTSNIQQAVHYDSSPISVRKIPSEELSKLLNDPDYGYNEVSKPNKTIFERLLEWLSRKLGNELSSDGGEISITVLEYLFIAAALGLIIFLLLKNNIRSVFYGKSATTTLDFTESIENINEIDFDRRIADEVSKRDFRRAIRLHFLKVIKELSDQKLINWQLDKTNSDYSRELKNSRYSLQFEELIRLYEYIWYGDFKLDEATFLVIIEKFNQFTINHQ
jgi:hypothetical protein